MVEKEHGEEAAQNYAQMVADIPVLSATDFLLSFYRLGNNDWNWDNKNLGNEKGIYVDGKTDDEKYAAGMATIASILGGSSERNDALAIGGQFLRDHDIEEPIKQERSSFY